MAESTQPSQPREGTEGMGGDGEGGKERERERENILKQTAIQQ